MVIDWQAILVGVVGSYQLGVMEDENWHQDAVGMIYRRSYIVFNS
jgi:hypothetical protein